MSKIVVNHPNELLKLATIHSFSTYYRNIHFNNEQTDYRDVIYKKQGEMNDSRLRPWCHVGRKFVYMVLT